MVSLNNHLYDLISQTQALFFPFKHGKIALAFPTQRWAAQLVPMNDHEST